MKVGVDLKKFSFVVASILASQTIVTPPVAATIAENDKSNENNREAFKVKPLKGQIEVYEEQKEEITIDLFEETYELQVDRDYDQSLSIPVHNKSEHSFNVYYRIVDQYKDIELGFDDYNTASVAMPIMLDEMQQIPMTFFMQNAELDQYEFMVEAVDATTNQVLDSANVTLNVTPFEFSVESQLEKEPNSSIKTLTIKNTGDRIPDLTIQAGQGIKKVASFSPVVSNAIVEENQELTVAILPDYEKLKQKGYTGEIILKSGGREIAVPITFDKYVGELQEISVQDLQQEYKNEIEKNNQLLFEEIATTINDDYQIALPEESEQQEAVFTENGGQYSYQLISKENPDVSAEYTIKVEKVGNGGAQASALGDKPQINTSFEGSMAVTEIKQSLSANDYKLLTDFSGAVKLEGNESFALTITEKIVEEGKLKNVLKNAKAINSAVGYVDNLTNYKYFEKLNETDPREDYQMQLDLIRINTILSASGHLAVLIFPQAKVAAIGLTVAAGATGFLISKLEKYIEKYPGQITSYSLLLKTLINQCINRRILSNNMEVPKLGDQVKLKGTGYIATKNYPYSNRASNETFNYFVNDQKVLTLDNVAPKKMTMLEFDTGTIKDGTINYTQINSHKNRGSYIIETDINVYLPIEEDSVFSVPNKQELMKNLVPVAPNYTTDANYYSFDKPYLVDGRSSNFKFSVFNEGIESGRAPVELYIDDVLYYSEIHDFAIGEKKEITVENVRLTAKKMNVKVIVNGEQVVFESNYKDNSKSINYSVLENDHTGPEVKLLSPTTDTEGKVVQFELKDPLAIEKATVTIDGVQYEPKKNGDRYSVYLEKPLSKGNHFASIVAMDYGGNRSVENYEISVVSKENTEISFTQEHYEIDENDVFNLKDALIIEADGHKLELINSFLDISLEVKQNGKRISSYSRSSMGTLEFRNTFGEIELNVTYNGKKATTKINIQELPSKTLQLNNLEQYTLYHVELNGHLNNRSDYLGEATSYIVGTAPKFRLINEKIDMYETFSLMLRGDEIFGETEISKTDFDKGTYDVRLHRLSFKDFDATKIKKIHIVSKSDSNYANIKDGITLVEGDYTVIVQEGNTVFLYEISINDDLEIVRDLTKQQANTKISVDFPQNASLVKDIEVYENTGEPMTVEKQGNDYFVPRTERSRIEFQVTDQSYQYKFTAYESLEEDLLLQLDDDIRLSGSIGQQIVSNHLTLPLMNFNLWNNSSSIDSIYTVTGEEVNMIIHYTNKETKEIVSFEFDKEDYENIPVPKKAGFYEFSISPNFTDGPVDNNSSNADASEPVDNGSNGSTTDDLTESTETDSSNGKPSESTNTGSTGATEEGASESNETPTSEQPEQPEEEQSSENVTEINTQLMGNELMNAKEKEIHLNAEQIKVTIDSNAVNAKEDEAYTISAKVENNQFQLAIEKDQVIPYFDKPITIELDPAVFGEEDLTSKVIMRKEDGVYYPVPHRIVDGKIIIETRYSGDYVFIENKKQFNDIAKLENPHYILALAERGIINGAPGNNYLPNEEITRAQFAAMLTRALAIQSTSETSFKDVEGKWYEDSVQALYETGITKGVSDTAFNPAGDLTRTQAAVMMYRTLQYLEVDLSTAEGIVPFPDAQGLADEAKESIAVLNALGIMTGREDGTFGPAETLTRSQMAKLLYKLFIELNV